MVWTHAFLLIIVINCGVARHFIEPSRTYLMRRAQCDVNERISQVFDVCVCVLMFGISPNTIPFIHHIHTLRARIMNTRLYIIIIVIIYPSESFLCYVYTLLICSWKRKRKQIQNEPSSLQSDFQEMDGKQQQHSFHLPIVIAYYFVSFSLFQLLPSRLLCKHAFTSAARRIEHTPTLWLIM